MKLTFYGAAGEVTGSQHLIETERHKILLDCGTFQGRRAESDEKNRQFLYDPGTISAVIISHAHLDHIGLLPLLVKRGFTGQIYSTAATRDLAELMLLDAAHIQVQDAFYARRHLFPGHDWHEPLYAPEDIPAVMKRFVVQPYHYQSPDWCEISPGIKARFYDAGHILGSAAVYLALADHDQVRRVVYSGDLGRWDAPLLRDPDTIDEPVDDLIMESTYGDRLHHAITEVELQMVETVKRVVALKAKIIVPAFSLGRTQELIYLLHRLTDQGRIPRLPIVIDSPLAQKVTTVFDRHQAEYDAASGQDFSQRHENPLEFRNLAFTHSVDESKALNNAAGPMMIISASGMASGGRIMHHLKWSLPNSQNTILFTGYQAEHTPGRRLINGARQIQIFGQNIPVHAKIVTINDLSAHADQSEIVRYVTSLKELKKVWLVHGEPLSAENLKQVICGKLPGVEVNIPARSASYII